MNKPSKVPLGASLVILSSFFYASYGIWTKLMGDFFEGYTASALRSVLVLLILLPIAVAYRQLQPLKPRQNWGYFAAMIVGSLFTWGPLYYAILHAGVGISLTISYAGIIIGSFLFGWLFAGERFTRDKALAAVLGFVGLGLIFTPTTSSLGWLALLGAAVSGLSAGANSVFAKKIHYDSMQSTLALWVASIIANFAMLLLIGEHPPDIGWHIEWFYLVLFAIASVIASWSVIKGLKLIDAGAAGILGLLEIIFGVLFGVLFFQERPGPAVLAGVLVIMLAAAIPYAKDYRTTSANPV